MKRRGAGAAGNALYAGDEQHTDHHHAPLTGRMRYQRQYQWKVCCVIVALGVVIVAVGWKWSSRHPTAPHPHDLDTMPEAVLQPTATMPLPLEREIPPSSAADTIPVAVADGWPNLFGPRHDGTTDPLNLNTEWSAAGPPEVWRQPVGSGYSSPVVADDDLVVLERRGDQEIVSCRDAKTGEVRWEFPYPTTYKCRYQYSDGPYSTPLITADRVFALGAEGQLQCLHRQTGALIWRRLLKDDYQFGEGLFAVGTSPLYEDGCLIINIGGESPGSGIVAIEAADGSTRWTATSDKAGYATPRAATIHGRRMVFVFTADGLVALNPRNGHVWWSIPFCSKAPDTINASSPVVDGDLVLVSMGPGPGSLCVRVLADASYQEVWRDRRVLDSTWSNLISRDGYVYGFSSKRMTVSFRCVELATGKLQWKWSSEIERGAALAAGDTFILWGEDGHLAALGINPIEPIVRALTDASILDGPCYSSPALQRGLLYLRNEKWLLCLDLRAKEVSGAAGKNIPTSLRDRQ